MDKQEVFFFPQSFLSDLCMQQFKAFQRARG
jgi:hypothetical protein